MKQQKKFITIKDRRQWASKVLHKHIELLTAHAKRQKRHIDKI